MGRNQCTEPQQIQKMKQRDSEQSRYHNIKELIL